MKTIPFLALALLLPLAGCSHSGTDAQTAGATDGAQATDDANRDTVSSKLSGEIRKAMHEAEQEMANENIDLDSVHVGSGGWHQDTAARARAEITPQGVLLIDGKPVEATPAQQALLLDYHRQVVGIATAGMELGAQGAGLGIDAARQSLLGAFTGRSDQDTEAALKPQNDRIRAAAAGLCQRLPGLLATQQKLAATMPAFKPYATLQQKKIDECDKDLSNGRKGVAVFSD